MTGPMTTTASAPTSTSAPTGAHQAVRATAAAAVIWADLSTTDVDGAVAFYGSLFGWRAERDTAEAGYIIVRNDEGDVGGMMALGAAEQAAGVTPAWTVVVGSDDLDASSTRVRRLGGTVVEGPLDIPGGARVAAVADPAGAVFALMQSPGGSGPNGADGPAMTRLGLGAVAWVECLSRDPAASGRFLEALLGWTSDERADGYVVLLADGRPAAGLMAMPPGAPPDAGSDWLVHFAVDDVAVACDRAVAAGGRVLEPVHDIAEGRFAVLADPQGAVLALFEPASGP